MHKNECTIPAIINHHWGHEYGFVTIAGGKFTNHRENGPSIVMILSKHVKLKWKLYNNYYHDTATFFKDTGHDDESVLYWVLKFGEKLPTVVTMEEDGSYLGIYNINDSDGYIVHYRSESDSDDS